MAEDLIQQYLALGDGSDTPTEVQIDFAEKLADILGDKMPCHLRGEEITGTEEDHLVYAMDCWIMCATCNFIFSGRGQEKVLHTDCSKCKKLICEGCVVFEDEYYDVRYCKKCIEYVGPCSVLHCDGMLIIYNINEYEFRAVTAKRLTCTKCEFEEIIKEAMTKATR